MKTYTNIITSLNENEIFVFGSNTQGRHGKGSAKYALDNFGAIYGQAKGLQGQSYAIVTKDLKKKIHPSVSLDYIKLQIQELYQYMENNKLKTAYIAYHGNKKNLNGYTPFEMAKMFASYDIPNNIVFESNFYNLIININKNKNSLF